MYKEIVDDVASAAGGGRRSLLVLRMILALACLNALVISLIALAASSGTLSTVRTALAGGAAVALSVVPLLSAPRIVYEQMTDETRWRRAPLFGALSAAVLLADAPASEVLFAALLTPVGVCVLVGDWWGACLCAVLLAGGLGGAVLQPDGPTSIETTLSNLIPVTVVIAGGLVPVKFAQSVMRTIARDLEFLRLRRRQWDDPLRKLPSQQRADSRRRNGEIVLARLRARQSEAQIHEQTGIRMKTIETHAAELRREEDMRREVLRHGNSNAVIAANLGLTRSQVKYTRKKLEREIAADEPRQIEALAAETDDAVEWGRA